jgi:hypothetical protein
MKKRVYVLMVCSLIFSVAKVRADDFKNNFGANINQKAIDALSEDLGAVINAGSFHQGKALGFPLGFDVGVHGALVGVQNDDKILRDDGSDVQSLFGQVEVGLPLRLNVIGRVGSVDEVNVYGGGLRWGVFTPSVPGLPAVSISGLYSKASHDYFDADVLSANAVLSFEIPFIHPYVGVGYDHTTLDISSEGMASASAGTTKVDGSADGTRIEAGVNLSLIPFTYLTLGGGVANGQKLFHAGLGVKF